MAKFKKIISGALTAALAVTTLSVSNFKPVQASTDYNYGEALQKSIMFYEFQRSGDLPDVQRNNWRGDSGLTDGADAGVDLTGGWYDAGDHVKFNLPMAYTVSMLSWSVYENRDAYVKSGQLSYILDNIKWASDYLIKCHTAPNEFYYQVGDAGLDHAWWGPAEVMQMNRPSYKVTLSSPGSAVVGEAAAALAATSIVFKDTDPTYSAKCLQHAKELFNFADATKSDAGYIAANGYYNSWSGFYDELSWSSAWLYLATNDSIYLNKAESYVPNWGTEPQSTTIAYKWAQCWDDVHYGAQLLLARITNKAIYKESVERSLDYWTTGYQGDRITYTPKGLAWMAQWGSLRYATTMAFLADVYADWAGCTSSKVSSYKNFAKSQTDYALGSTGRSFEIGFGVNSPQHPHHRTAQGSWADSMSVPGYHRHTLYGALVGGPDSSDGYTDEVSNYTTNEVACDYNAGFVGILARMYADYGGNPIPDFKAIETPTNDEFFAEAGVNASGSNFVEIKAYLNNKSGWPAKVGDKLSFKYFVDISELVKAGYSAKDVTINTNYNGGAVVTGLLPWDASKNIYYVNVDFTGTKIYPGGQSAYRKEIQFRMSAPQNVNIWDNSNDFSYKGIVTTPGATPVLTKNIPVYDAGKLVYGNEPGSGTPENNSTITPTNASFDKNTTKQADILVDMTLNGNTLSAIYNGTTKLTADSDYTVSGTTVTISKAYLAKQPVATTQLTFDFSGGIDPILTVTVTDSSVSKVAAPTFSVAGGVYSTAQTVELSCATSGATIRYTTDGSTPTAASPAYSAPITISSTVIIKAYAVKSGMTDSEVSVATYTISGFPQQGIVVTYAVVNQWNNGATINVTIKNNGTAPINGWTAVWTLPTGQSVSNMWNAAYTITGSSISVNNMSYNSTIDANGGTQSFGFNLNYSGTFTKPASITLNEVSYQVQ